MYAMAGLMSVATLSHVLMRPLDPKHYEETQQVAQEDAKAT